MKVLLSITDARLLMGLYKRHAPVRCASLRPYKTREAGFCLFDKLEFGELCHVQYLILPEKRSSVKSNTAKL